MLLLYYVICVKHALTNSLILQGVGFTCIDPNNSDIEGCRDILQYKRDDQGLLYLDSQDVSYNHRQLCSLDFSTYKLNARQSLGIILTKDRIINWFVDGEWKGGILVDNYPLDRPLWGIIDVCCRCTQVTAEICDGEYSLLGDFICFRCLTYTLFLTCLVSTYAKSHERLLLESGLLTLPNPAPLKQSSGQGGLNQKQPQSEELIRQLLQEQESLRQQVQTKNEEIQAKDAEFQRKDAEIQRKDSRIQGLQEELIQERETVASVSAENHQLQQQVVGLRRMVSSLSATTRTTPSSNEIDFWQVSPDEVSVREDKVLGGGAWGYVAKGTFRGTAVAVKRVYRQILHQSTLERVRREIRTMSQIRHPHLVLFIAAVLDEKTGPMIVTELLDISLREAYQANRIGNNKRRIFQHITSALVYLHQQREPIIHRDVSSANVLLNSLPNNTWLAKLSDFGSANLARYASTPGEGSILYTAPEAYPHPPNSPTPPPPQTTKIDVYSFGVLACEVITRVFPESDKFSGLIEAVGHSWPQIHQLVSSCVSYSPQDRPTTMTILTRLQQLDSEPCMT